MIYTFHGEYSTHNIIPTVYSQVYHDDKVKQRRSIERINAKAAIQS